MFQNLRAVARQIKRESAREFLHSEAPRLLKANPQMCCYSFDGIGIDINIDGQCDRAALDLLLQIVDIRGKNILDVGANIGNHAAAFARTAGHVFAFEPHPRTYQLLRLNLSDFPNVTIFNLGASDKVASVKAVSPKLNMGAASISDREPRENETSWSFDVAPLDSVTEFSDLALFKLDVEGHELQALRGAEGLLAKHRPAVVFEQNADTIKGGTSPSVDFLKSLGYEYFYSVETSIPWRVPQALPSPLRKALRLIEGAAFGPPERIAHLVPADRLEQRDYSMLIASVRPLSR